MLFTQSLIPVENFRTELFCSSVTVNDIRIERGDTVRVASVFGDGNEDAFAQVLAIYDEPTVYHGTTTTGTVVQVRWFKQPQDLDLRQLTRLPDDLTNELIETDQISDIPDIFIIGKVELKLHEPSHPRVSRSHATFVCRYYLNAAGSVLNVGHLNNILQRGKGSSRYTHVYTNNMSGDRFIDLAVGDQHKFYYWSCTAKTRIMLHSIRRRLRDGQIMAEVVTEEHEDAATVPEIHYLSNVMYEAALKSFKQYHCDWRPDERASVPIRLWAFIYYVFPVLLYQWKRPEITFAGSLIPPLMESYALPFEHPNDNYGNNNKLRRLVHLRGEHDEVIEAVVMAHNTIDDTYLLVSKDALIPLDQWLTEREIRVAVAGALATMSTKPGRLVHLHGDGDEIIEAVLMSTDSSVLMSTGSDRTLFVSTATTLPASWRYRWLWVQNSSIRLVSSASASAATESLFAPVTPDSAYDNETDSE